MHDLHHALRTLDRLYRDVSLEEYEQARQVLTIQIQQLLPGFTVAYALEIGTVGAGNGVSSHGSVMHVLFPIVEEP